MSKSYFGILDSRNTKYQGLINDDQFAGIGMLIDQTTTFAISTWNASTMNGPSLIIYPSTQIFFGTLEANKPKGIVCFQFSRNEKCIINFANNGQRNHSQKITIAYVTSGQSVVQVTANPQKNQFKVVQVYYANNQEDELKLLTKIFTPQISKDKIDLASFINKQFVQTSNLFELSGKNQQYFGFKDTISIGFKMENNVPTSIGFFKPFPRNLIFGRKIHYNIALPAKTTVEEGYFEPYVKTLTCLKEKASSLEFQKLSEDYFKKSTTFRNQFVMLDHLSKIYKELKDIGEKAKFESAKKFGQTLLENDYGSSHQNPNDLVIKEYTLEEMREQIYKAAARRNKTHYNLSKSPIRQRAKKPLENLYLNDIDSPKKDILTVRKTKEPQITRSHTIFRSKQKQNTPFTDERIKKGFTYQHNKKQDAIKEVNQIIKTTKQQQKALLQDLFNDFKSQYKSSMKKRQFNYTENVEEPVERNRKYQRYEPKITPFSQINQRNSRSALKSSNGRQVKYSHYQKAKQDHASIPQRGLQEFIRRDESFERITAFDLNREETNMKSHSNLSKYKERNKKATIDNLMKKDQKHHPYKYLDENQSQKQGYGMQRDGSQEMPEIKLFEERTRRNKENQPESQRNTRSGRYLDQDLSKSTHLGRENSYSQRYLYPERSSVIDKTQNHQKYRGLGEKNLELKRNYSKLMLYENTNNTQYMRNQERKKLKRTFHYID